MLSKVIWLIDRYRRQDSPIPPHYAVLLLLVNGLFKERSYPIHIYLGLLRGSRGVCELII